MANVVQPSAKKEFLDGNIDLIADTVKVVLINLSNYTYSAAHANLSDIPSAARTAITTLASKTTTGGAFNAADATFASVIGNPSAALAIVKDTGTESASPFITYIDSGVTGLPVTPNGANILIQWHASGIIAL